MREEELRGLENSRKIQILGLQLVYTFIKVANGLAAEKENSKVKRVWKFIR